MRRWARRATASGSSGKGGVPLPSRDLVSDLSTAIADGRIYAHYQPIVDLRSGLATSYEVLARWTDRDGQDVVAGQFVPAVEESGQIAHLTRHMLSIACEASARWHAAGLSIPLTVNISPLLLADSTAATLILDALDHHELPHELLAVEVTESGIDTDVPTAAKQLDRLHASGVRCGLDDFGAGQNTLNKLRAFPLSVLKIAPSFMAHICEDPVAFDIVESICLLGNRLGLTVVAAGIESAGSLHAAQRAGCDSVQGFYVSEPLRHSMVPAYVGVFLDSTQEDQ